MENIKKDLKDLLKGVKSISKKIEKLAGDAQKVKPVSQSRKKGAAKKEGPTSLEVVFEIIKSAKNGINTAALVKNTGYNTKKVQNVIFKLKKQGKIKTKVKGIYIPA